MLACPDVRSGIGGRPLNEVIHLGGQAAVAHDRGLAPASKRKHCEALAITVAVDVEVGI